VFYFRLFSAETASAFTYRNFDYLFVLSWLQFYLLCCANVVCFIGTTSV